ncbi:MAG: beta-lactamase family protein [Gemmatimonadetes bacterium]|nr:beta-lactamase family protein [Gemmatimonadota bacterium]
MTRSGYADLSTMTNTAGSYDADGRPAPIYRYASRAATGFTTSAGDLVKLVLAHLRSVPESPLAQATLASMRVTQARTLGADLWGLGTVLYAPTREGDLVFGHDGTNEPAISATVRINPSAKDAIIVLATGSKTLASRLGAEWVFWQTGLPDVLTIPAEIRSAGPILGLGVGGILLLVFVPAWRRWKTHR